MKEKIVRIHGVTLRGPSDQVHDKQIVIAAGNYANTTPFLSLPEDWFAAPRGFETHPHRGMQTVTFVRRRRAGASRPYRRPRRAAAKATCNG